MENDSEFEHVKMKGHRNSVLALVLFFSKRCKCIFLHGTAFNLIQNRKKQIFLDKKKRTFLQKGFQPIMYSCSFFGSNFQLSLVRQRELCLKEKWDDICAKSRHTAQQHDLTFLLHKVAQPTKWRFLPKNSSQLVIFVIGLAFTWV